MMFFLAVTKNDFTETFLPATTQQHLLTSMNFGLHDDLYMCHNHGQCYIIVNFCRQPSNFVQHTLLTQKFQLSTFRSFWDVAVYLASNPSLLFLAIPFALERNRFSLPSSSLSMLSLLFWGALSLALVSLSRSKGS